MPKVTSSSQQNSQKADIGQRKADHIRINLEENVNFPRQTTGLENYSFIHQAIPELNLADIDTSLKLFGKELAAPLLISSMTGGTDQAMELNRRLASVAQIYGIAMGVGSQRAAVEDPALAHTFQVRDAAPDILLFANLGAVQLNYGYNIAECRQAVQMIEADALILHFNVLQEAVQPEGDTEWGGLLDKVAEVCSGLNVPVIAKEVGWGFSNEAATELAMAGISAIDVAGAGGTSWSEVEFHRAPTVFHARVARAFADWGIPTVESIQNVRSTAPDLTIFASGGLRDGIDIAKCVALGADLGGMAGNFLRAAAELEEALDETVRVILAQLRIAMMCAAASTLDDLKMTPLQKVGGVIS